MTCDLTPAVTVSTTLLPHSYAGANFPADVNGLLEETMKYQFQQT